MWGYLTLFLLFISFYLLLKIYTAFFQPLPTVKRNGPFKGKETPKGSYDVIIVGAGPAGSVMGHYLAKEGKKVNWFYFFSFLSKIFFFSREGKGKFSFSFLFFLCCFPFLSLFFQFSAFSLLFVVSHFRHVFFFLLRLPC